MNESMMNTVLLFAIPYFVLTMLMELLVGRLRKNQTYALKDALASLSMGLGNMLVGFLSISFVAGVLFFFYRFAVLSPGTAWWSWGLLFIGVDLCWYFDHRMGHESRFFWASHVVHHSSRHYHLATGLRQTWTGKPIAVFFYIPLALLGFHPGMILVMISLHRIAGYWVHTEHIPKLGYLEYVFCTPSNHRVHHGVEKKYLDRNYGGIFIVWDRLFGTFQEEEESPTYGLTKNIESFNPFVIAFHEWVAVLRDMQNANGPREALYYIFGSPTGVARLRGNSLQP